MPKINSHKLLHYDVHELYALVLDIDLYSQFLPFCVASTIVQKEDDKIIADLTVQFKVFTHSYRSVVTHKLSGDFAEIRAEAIHSDVFKYLHNYWTFNKTENGTAVDFVLDFEFQSATLGYMLDLLLINAERKMIDAFQQRAKYIYGDKS